MTAYGSDYVAWRKRVMQPLADEFTAFCAKEKLPVIVATELVNEPNLTTKQRDWISEFIERWRAVEKS